MLKICQAPKGESASGVERSTFALFMQPDWYVYCMRMVIIIALLLCKWRGLKPVLDELYNQGPTSIYMKLLEGCSSE